MVGEKQVCLDRAFAFCIAGHFESKVFLVGECGDTY